MYNVNAYQIAGAISIRECRLTLPWERLSSDSDELFYKFGEEKFLYIFRYGTVGFFNFSQEGKKGVLNQLKQFCLGFKRDCVSKELNIVVQKDGQKVSFNTVVLPAFDVEAIRMVILNIIQAVALDNYAEITGNLMGETILHTTYLEQNGKLNISRKKLKKYIGKVLNLKNHISENLHILQSPAAVGENENHNRLNLALKKTFDLQDRYRYTNERLEIIKDSLALFKNILDHKESCRLEWIIILLIAIEIIDLFFLRILNW